MSRLAEMSEDDVALDALRRLLPARIADELAGHRLDSLLGVHRREIVVFFADVRGFTSFTETAEPEEVMSLLREFHGALSVLVDRYEASVGDFAGDGVMAYFNDPMPAPDAPDRAIRMALELRERFVSIRRRWLQLGHDLDVGFGIAAGYATLGLLGPTPRIDYKPVGTVVNVAARLCARAGPGEILVSQAVLNAASDDVLAEADGDLTLKGLHRPIRAFRVLGLGGDEEPAGANGRSIIPFVGRAQELMQVESVLAHLTGGMGRVVLISGEPGIGKTRLTEELARRASRLNMAVAWGRCTERQGAPAFWPWMQVVERLASTAGGTLETALGTGAGVISQVVPKLAELLPELDPPPPLDPEAARFRLYDAIAQFLRRLAAGRPVAVLLDDLHWADLASLQLLSHLAANIGDAPVVVVATYRDVDPPVGPPLSDALADLAREPITLRLPLAGLNPPEVSRLIRATSGGEPSEALVESVHDRTEGNPFFVGELVRLLESDGQGSFDGPDAFKTGVPVGVREVIRRRVSRLPEATAALLRHASVAGREVRFDVLARLGDHTPDATLDALEPALESRMLTLAPGSVDTYRFSHALVNQTLYEELGPASRARLHRRVGEILEESGAPRDDLHLPELALHFFLALPASSVEKAFDYALRAADWAQGRLAYEQAEEQLARAIELVGRLPAAEQARHELDVQMRLVLLHMTTKGYGSGQVGRALARARDLSHQLGSSGQVAAALWGLCAFHLERAEFDTAEAIGKELEAFGERSDDAVLIMTGSWALGLVAFNRGRLVEAAQLLDRAATTADSLRDPSLAELFSQHPPATCRAFLALVRWLLADHDGADRTLAEASAKALEVGHTFSLANVRIFEAMVGAFAGDPAVAKAAAEETMALCRDRGFRLFHAAALIVRGWAVARDGDVAAGREQLEAGLAESVEIGSTMFHHVFLGLRADALGRAGETEAALATVGDAIRECENVGGRFWSSALHELRAALMQSFGLSVRA